MQYSEHWKYWYKRISDLPFAAQIHLAKDPEQCSTQEFSQTTDDYTLTYISKTTVDGRHAPRRNEGKHAFWSQQDQRV